MSFIFIFSASQKSRSFEDLEKVVEDTVNISRDALTSTSKNKSSRVTSVPQREFSHRHVPTVQDLTAAATLQTYDLSSSSHRTRQQQTNLSNTKM